MQESIKLGKYLGNGEELFIDTNDSQITLVYRDTMTGNDYYIKGKEIECYFCKLTSNINNCHHTACDNFTLQRIRDGKGLAPIYCQGDTV